MISGNNPIKTLECFFLGAGISNQLVGPEIWCDSLQNINQMVPCYDICSQFAGPVLQILVYPPRGTLSVRICFTIDIEGEKSFKLCLMPVYFFIIKFSSHFELVPVM